MSILDLLELRMTEVVVTTGVIRAVRCAKLQIVTTNKRNTPFFYRPDALPVPQPTVSEN